MVPPLTQRTTAIVVAHTATAIVLVELAVFYAFVGRARLVLGYWPAPYRPDPMALGFSVHHAITTIGGGLTAATPVLAVILLIAARRLGLSRRDLVTASALFGACYLGWFTLFHLDPGGFGVWFLD